MAMEGKMASSIIFILFLGLLPDITSALLLKDFSSD
jgi:hypothetical protein